MAPRRTTRRESICEQHACDREVQEPDAVDTDELASRVGTLYGRAAGATLSTAEALRCRVRYFTDGAALGSPTFVDSVFKQNRDQFGPKRKTGARKLRWGDWEGLCAARDLRKTVITPPGNA